jgi:hypothetical protein
MSVINTMVMNPMEMCSQIDVKAFMKRRGMMPLIGIIVLAGIILFQLYLR